MGMLFISYRRADSGSVVGRIYDHLAEAFGAEAIFRDVDGIPGAVDFREAIDEALDACAIALVVIGPQWLVALDAAGRRRLDDPADVVRLEIEGALARGMAILPLLVQGAAMPAAADLPPSLAQLSYRNARLVRDDPDFTGDMRRVITDISPYLVDGALPTAAPVDDVEEQPKFGKFGGPDGARASTNRIGLRILLATIVVAGLGAAVVLLSHLGPATIYTPNLLEPPTMHLSCNRQPGTPLAPATFTFANDDRYDSETVSWSAHPLLADGGTWGTVSPSTGTLAHGKMATVTIQFSSNLCSHIEASYHPGLDFLASAQVSYAAAGASGEYFALAVDITV